MNYQPGLTSGYTRFPLPFHFRRLFLLRDSSRARVGREQRRNRKVKGMFWASLHFSSTHLSSVSISNLLLHLTKEKHLLEKIGKDGKWKIFLWQLFSLPFTLSCHRIFHLNRYHFRPPPPSNQGKESSDWWWRCRKWKTSIDPPVKLTRRMKRKPAYRNLVLIRALFPRIDW